MTVDRRRNSGREAKSAGRAGNVALWVLQVLAAAAFVGSGMGKLLGAQAMVELFAAIGIGQWFRYATGVLEIGGGALLLVPAAAGLGAALLGVVMVGAIATHLFVVGGSALTATVLLLVVSFIVLGRRARTARLVGRILDTARGRNALAGGGGR